MANLVTHHDPFHVHKILGVLALLNYIVRMFMLLYVGKSYVTMDDYNHGKCTWNRLKFDCACVVLHGMLSWSSLLLPLPKKRNFSSPMIWTEFRLHSIIFASRHVIGALLAMWGLWPTNLALNYVSKLGLVLGTCYTADYITTKYGCKDKRTTNAMPYPSNITDALQKGIKKNYAQAQFLAVVSVLSEDCDASFWPLLGIQSAPLLMTLVRKGKVSALFYHRVYTICLGLPAFPAVLGAMIHRYTMIVDQMFTVGLICTVPYEIRVRFRQTKLVTWGLGVGVGISACQGPLLKFICSFHHNNPPAKLFSASIVFLRFWYKYRYFYPLFDLETNVVPRAPHDVAIDLINRQFNLNINVKSVLGPDKMLKYH